MQHGTNYEGSYYAPTTTQLRQAGKVAYFGWYQEKGLTGSDGLLYDNDLKQYAFTQQMIWETIGQSSGRFVDDDIQNEYIAFRNEVNQKMTRMQTRPSFDATTVTIRTGETTTLTDSNGVLADYKTIDVTEQGIRITHNKGENTMQIQVNEECTLENYVITDDMFKNWGMIKEGTENKNTTVYIEFADGVQDQLYSLNYNDPTAMRLNLAVEAKGKLEITKLDSNGTLVDGAVFKITSADGYNNTVTVTNGRIVVEDLKAGIYTIKELTAPYGYLLDTKSYNVEVKPSQEVNKTIPNDEPTGELTIEKTDKQTGNHNRADGTSHHGDASIEGAVYTLYAKSDIYNVSRSLKYFSKDEPIATFTFNRYGVASIRIINTSTRAEISIKGNTLRGLPMGSYYAKETTVPTGYTQDTDVYNYTFSYKDSTTAVIEVSGTVKNVVKKAPFEVIKVATDTNDTAKVVADAEFTAILTKYVDYYGSFNEALKHIAEFAEDEYSIFKTGTDGHGISGLLAYGEYTVNETYTPSPEINTVEQFYVRIDKDSRTPIREYVENDSPFSAYLKLEKQDKETGKYVVYSNATFELYKLGEDNRTWEKVQCKVKNQYFDSWTTDENGIAMTETKLEAGSYKLTEIKIPTGYLQLDEELRFEVNNRNATLEYDNDWDAWLTVTAKNEQPKGKLEIVKTINLKENMDLSLIKDIDFTQIAFELVANDDIIDYADGSVVYKAGTKIGKYNLNSDGILTIDNLKMGKYYLKEVSTIEGAVLDDTKYDVIFEQKDTTTKKYEVKLNIENETTGIEISKQDITGEKELEGATLTVLDDEGNIIDTWVSSEKTHKIEGLTVGKTYVLREKIAPDGFVRATDIEFTIQNTGEIQRVAMIDKVVTMTKTNIAGNEIEGAELKVLDKDGNIVDSWTSEKEPHKIKGLIEGESYTLIEDYAPDGYVISNEIEFTVTKEKETQEITMTDKIVEISKTDVEGNTIEGVTLSVISNKTKNIVDKWTTTKESHKVSGLIEGESYILREEIVIDGYVKAKDIEFTVTTEKETQNIIMIDKIVEMSKVNIGGEEIEGATIQVLDKEGNIVDEWISEKEPHKINNLVEGETYILHEEIAVDGYVKATDIEFTVTEDKDTQKLTMIDKIVEIIKTDLVTGEELEGAELTVTDEDGNIIDTWISTKEPHKVIGLEEGKVYTLTEVTCPYGYEQAETIEFEVTEDKETQLIEMKDMPILKNVQVVKIDSSTKEVIKDKFTFGIYEDEECTRLIKELESNSEEGKVLFEDLRYGIYYIKELNAPKGYQISDKTVKIEINDKGVFANEIQLEETNEVYSFEYENTKLDTPKTRRYICMDSFINYNRNSSS